MQASGTDLQTLNATVGSTVEQEAIAQLPSLLHDAGTFTTLQVGVSPDGSVAGTVVDQSTFSLDGGNNTNDMDGSMSVYTGSFAGDPTGIANQNRNVAAGATGVMPTPTDSVEEFKVNATNQTADFNNSAGAQVSKLSPSAEPTDGMAPATSTTSTTTSAPTPGITMPMTRRPIPASS